MSKKIVSCAMAFLIAFTLMPCAAFAEDIVKGEASEDDCIVHMRQKIKEFYQLLKEEND